jgi:hypothetical protein
MDRRMKDRPHPGNDPMEDERHWPDSVFRAILVFWLVLGFTSILKSMLFARMSVAQVVLVAWGVVVIFVLWFRMGPPRETRSEVLR